MAGISTDHYTRLEQARGSAPSRPVVAAVARALRCDDDQRDHLFHLAGLTAPERRRAGQLSAGLVELADRLVDVPVAIITDLSELLWANRLFVVLTGEDVGSGRREPLIRRWFLDPRMRSGSPEEEWERLSAAHVSDLRATYARRAGDQQVGRLVADLLEHSTEFRRLWDHHHVAVRRSDRKTMIHPEVGPVSLRCEVLLTPSADVKLLAFFPLPGTDAQEKLDLLRVIGNQEFGAADASPETRAITR